MKQFVESLFGLRKGERGLALMMFLYHYLLLVTLYLLKPIRDSLFLTHRGAPELPLVFVMTSIAVIPMAMLYTRAGRRMRLSWLVNGTTLVLVGSLIVLRWLLGAEEFVGGWIYYLLYVWVSIYGVLITSQFWLFANAVFDSAQAKRVFTMLSLGAILGAVTGGELTSLLVEYDIMQSENLIYIAAAVLGFSIFVVNGIRARVLRDRSDAIERESTEDEPLGLLGIFDVLRGSRHLLLIVGIISLAVLTTTMVDFQFKTVAAELKVTEDALASFLGRFYSRVSIIALLVQIIVAPKLIRMIGAGYSLLLLPLGLVVGTAGMLAIPMSLSAATALRGIDQSLRHSIDRTGRELLFLPVSLETKKRVKVFIDLFMDHGAQGLGGLLLIWLTVGLGFGLTEISLVMLGLLGAWILLVVLARSSYVEEFRDTLEEQVEPYEEEEPAAVGAQTVTEQDFDHALQRALSSQDFEEITAGLHQLEEGDDRVPVSSVQRLLGHKSPEVRRHAIRVLRKRKVGEMIEPVTPHLEDVAPAVRLEAARYLYRNLNGERLQLLERGLAHPDVRVRIMVVGLIAKEGDARAFGLLSNQYLRDMATRDGEYGEEARLQVARVLGVIDRPALDELFTVLLKDPSTEVRKRVIESIGERGVRSLVPVLFNHLMDDEYAESAASAVAAFGDRILGTAYDYLTDPREDEQLRRQLAAALAGHSTQSSADVLMTALQEATAPVRHAIIKTLSILRTPDNRLKFSKKRVRREVRDEARYYTALGRIYHLWRREESEAAKAFEKEDFEKARKLSLENIFLLLSLYYIEQDMQNAYRGLTSDDPNLRAGALEFVDNLVDWDTKQFLLPILDDPEGDQASKLAGEIFELQLTRWPEALAFLLRNDDPALIVPAIRSARRMNVAGLNTHVEAAQSHPNQAVRRAALRPLD